MNERLRVGIIGCGEVAQILHLPSLYGLSEQFEVTALCDVSREVLSGIGGRWGVAAQFEHYEEVLGQEDVDVVLVANPHAYHSEVVLAALSAGKHVLVEKPMCLTLREADAIVEAQRRTGLVVQVGTMRRYVDAGFQQAVTAARYLCQAGGDLTTQSGWRDAIAAYNPATSYAGKVAEAASRYAAAAG